ncbi:hypothetical protein HF086_004562 [Spodoptera exigua]|uniref:ER-bound oxygenase mpaB/mpaB'/Rubber oxygenase catalytic domain-containing protein n=1 Tax=Spodoptera exigua TaxID=7107 RepID=A0A922MDD6_SPOEX|nr:hypothetical protein HF086_004562 [Spodoptera exigua]
MHIVPDNVYKCSDKCPPIMIVQNHCYHYESLIFGQKVVQVDLSNNSLTSHWSHNTSLGKPLKSSKPSLVQNLGLGTGTRKDELAEAFVDALLTQEALDQPSDKVKPEELVLELPKWFDEEKFNKGRRFYLDNCFAMSSSMLLGLVAVFSIPSILRILVGTRRSNSVYTAYRRYLSTLLHTISWFENELKPGSISWKSLYAVRSRHLRAGLASKIKGMGVVSQRDLALTQFGVDSMEFMCKPAIDGLPTIPPRLLYYKDFNTIETSPYYKHLTFKAKYKMYMYNLYSTLYTSYLGRLYINLNFWFSVFLMRYFPYLAFFKFGIKNSLVNIFEEDPTDETKPVTNAEYLKNRKPEPWYSAALSLIW